MASQLQILAGTMADDATVGTVAWSNPNNAKVSDDVYATATIVDSNPSHYLKATNFGFSIPAGATISGILAEVELSMTDTKDYSVRIVKGGTISGDNKALGTTNEVESYRSYGSSSDLWGETWTSTDINASTFGVVFSTIIATTPVDVAYVDHIRITVYYTEAGWNIALV